MTVAAGAGSTAAWLVESTAFGSWDVGGAVGSGARWGTGEGGSFFEP